jgi:hypothetical protein
MKRFVFLVVFCACSSGLQTKKDIGVAPRDSGNDDYGCDSLGDDCFEQACQACVEECGMGCLTMESYPPQFACDGGGSWDVYEFCPDWQPEDSGE